MCLVTSCSCAGNDDELADWAAFQTVTASAWKRGWAKGTLKEWAHDLLQKVLFKVGSLLLACKCSYQGLCGVVLCSAVCRKHITASEIPTLLTGSPRGSADCAN